LRGSGGQKNAPLATQHHFDVEQVQKQAVRLEFGIDARDSVEKVGPG